MSLSFTLLKPPLPPLSSHVSLSPKFSSLTLTTPPTTTTTTTFPIVRAMRSMQGRVVCTANDKTVAVEVTRLAPHPKYKRRVRKKKKFQAHDPDNQFKVGDWVQLEKCRPISKTKTFLAVLPTLGPKAAEPAQLGIPLQAQQQ